jgi:hypothetical protein
VAHARQVFDAAIRRVEPPRPRPVRETASPAPPADAADEVRTESGDLVPQAVGEDADG